MILELLAIKELNKTPQIPQPTSPVTVQVEPPKKIETKRTYVIKRGDTLSKIASEHNTSVLRLFYKNKGISHPDEIKVGTKLVIPSKSEKLKKRSIIEPARSDRPELAKPSQPGGFSGSTGLNGYDYPSCTGHVALKRYVPRGWGNASSWLSNAIKDGYKTGSTPRAGAIGWRGNHVVYVVAVHGSSITISENNYDYAGSTRTIQRPANYYTYIY